MVCNHQSHFDPPLVGSGVPRMMTYLARKTLFEIPVLGPFIHSVNAIPIDRDGLGLGGIKESLRRLKQGQMVLIFPEGTRIRDGRIAPFRPGFTTLAVRAKAAIVPAAIHGAFDAWPRSQPFPGRHPVHVGYGKPIGADELSRYDERSLVAEIERRVRECHAKLQAHPIFARPGCGSKGLGS